MFKKIKKKLALYSIRKNMAFFGYDLSHFTDEELEQATQRLNYLARLSGLTLEQTIKATGSLTKVLTMKPKSAKLIE